MSLVNIDFPNCQLNIVENSGNNSVSVIGSGVAVSNLSDNTSTNINSNQLYVLNGESGSTNTVTPETSVIMTEGRIVLR